MVENLTWKKVAEGILGGHIDSEEPVDPRLGHPSLGEEAEAPPSWRELLTRSLWQEARAYQTSARKGFLAKLEGVLGLGLNLEFSPEDREAAIMEALFELIRQAADRSETEPEEESEEDALAVRPFGEPGDLHIIYHGRRSEERRVRPQRFRFGTCEPWYKEPQWLMEAYCFERGDMRTFALTQIGVISDWSKSWKASMNEVAGLTSPLGTFPDDGDPGRG